MKLIAGLGNPGEKYARTRHNIGFMVLGELSRRVGIPLKKSGHQGVYGVGRIGGAEVMLLQPLTYMNLSGASVGSAFKSLGIEPGDLVVVHDDIELPFGTLRIRKGGGHGGHNGIRHIREVLGTGDFIRVKVGVGRPVSGGDVSAHVLGAFSATERQQIELITANSSQAIEMLLSTGMQQAMSEFNNRDISQ